MSPAVQVAGSPVLPLSVKRTVPKAPWSTMLARVFAPSVKASVPVLPIEIFGAVLVKTSDVEVPSETLPEPPWIVRSPAFVMNDEAAPDLRSKAPEAVLPIEIAPVEVPAFIEVVKAPARLLMAILPPEIDVAPPATVRPRLPVKS